LSQATREISEEGQGQFLWRCSTNH